MHFFNAHYPYLLLYANLLWKEIKCNIYLLLIIDSQSLYISLINSDYVSVLAYLYLSMYDPVFANVHAYLHMLTWVKWLHTHACSLCSDKHLPFISILFLTKSLPLYESWTFYTSKAMVLCARHYKWIYFLLRSNSCK